MWLLVPNGTRRRGLPCEEAPASPAPAPVAGSGRTVVVGIRRELLTWALIKVANAGDHVVAAAADGLLMGVDEWSRAADALSSVLVVYDGLCNLKQIIKTNRRTHDLFKWMDKMKMEKPDKTDAAYEHFVVCDYN